MEQGKIVAICQLGGVFATNADGSISYCGGEAHAIDVDRGMKLEDLKAEMANMFSCDTGAFMVKYLLPSNRRTLITISNDKDLQRMVDFSAGSVTTDVFLVSSKRENKEVVVAAAAAAAATDALGVGAFGSTPEGTKRLKVSEGWEKLITGVGQSFESVKEFRDALHKYAIGKGFMYKFLKNDGTRVTAVCSAEDCQWRIHASVTSPRQKLVIKTLNEEHTCEHDFGRDGHRLANQKWVASIIKEKLRESPNYKPREIASDLQRDYGLSLNYTQAWRGKSFAKKELLNSDEEVCSQLPWYCERIRKTNPGSIAALVATEDTRFERLFVAFYASLHGFGNGCRPLLFLDGISLKLSRQWKLLAATGVDAENEAFPVAFAIVLMENEENWVWFLGQLKPVLPAAPTVTFVSNRRNGLAEAVPQVFEDGYHGHCLSDLVEDFKARLEELPAEEGEGTKDGLVEDLKRAAYAYKAEEFNECVERIKDASKEAAEWVLGSRPDLWSNASFKGLRFDTLWSSATDLYNAWLGKVGRQEPTVIQVVDWVRCKLMERIYTHRESSNAWSGDVLTPSANQRLEQETAKACSLEVTSSTGSVYEVRDGADARVDVVNIGTWECTCRKWQVSGLPCVHAVAVIHGAHPSSASAFAYCAKYFTTDFYRSTYSQSINPIPDVGRPILLDSPNKYPLRTPRLPGRPKQRPAEPQRIISKRTVQCSKCKEYGHNKATCKPAAPT